MKMLEMIKKHTVPETSNHRTISGMVDRAKEMLHSSKTIAWSFVRDIIHYISYYRLITLRYLPQINLNKSH